MDTPKPAKGTWVLISPDGQEFKSDSPLKCCREEQKTRVPSEVALARVEAVLNLCELCEESDSEFILAKDTPSEIAVCKTCRDTIFQHSVYSKSKEKITMPYTINIY